MAALYFRLARKHYPLALRRETPTTRGGRRRQQERKKINEPILLFLSPCIPSESNDCCIALYQRVLRRSRPIRRWENWKMIGARIFAHFFLFRCSIRLRFLLGKHVTNKKMSIPRNATKKTGKGQNRSEISKTKIELLFLLVSKRRVTLTILS